MKEEEIKTLGRDEVNEEKKKISYYWSNILIYYDKVISLLNILYYTMIRVKIVLNTQNSISFWKFLYKIKQIMKLEA